MTDTETLLIFFFGALIGAAVGTIIICAVVSSSFTRIHNTLDEGRENRQDG